MLEVFCLNYFVVLPRTLYGNVINMKSTVREVLLNQDASLLPLQPHFYILSFIVITLFVKSVKCDRLSYTDVDRKYRAHQFVAFISNGVGSPFITIGGIIPQIKASAAT